MDSNRFARFMADTDKMIGDLRKESAKYRTQRNEARAEAVALRAELEAVKAGR
ncbi:hypothetical protein ABQF34_07225 [Mycolicibacterium boenickei]